MEKRRRYTREFKLEAVRLVESGIPKARVARDLGISNTVLKLWCQQVEEDKGEAFPGQGKMRPAEAELARLKRELTKVTAERDILKKALGYFAKEPQ
jgi:transposase